MPFRVITNVSASDIPLNWLEQRLAATGESFQVKQYATDLGEACGYTANLRGIRSSLRDTDTSFTLGPSIILSGRGISGEMSRPLTKTSTVVRSS